MVIFDRIHNDTEIHNFISTKVGSIATDYNILTLDSGKFENSFNCDSDSKIYNHSVLGGTFDRLHLAHKLLLTEAALRSKCKVTVGVTEESMLPGGYLKIYLAFSYFRVVNFVVFYLLGEIVYSSSVFKSF